MLLLLDFLFKAKLELLIVRRRDNLVSFLYSKYHETLQKQALDDYCHFLAKILYNDYIYISRF